MKEELVHQLTYLISVRGWPFIMEFDKVIGYAKESGLYDAWEKSVRCQHNKLIAIKLLTDHYL